MADVRGARILRLLNDPELHGDLLLVGMAIAALRDFGSGKSKFHLFAADLWPGRPDPVRRLRWVLAGDVRTYKPPEAARDCQAPMQRRSGLCAQPGREVHTWRDNGTVLALMTDWVTGEYRPISACSRHVPWAERTLRANEAAKSEDPPLPLANSGGVLARHFPELNWYRLWANCDPFWQQHPEVKPWPKPTLEVVLGEGSSTAEDDQRPPLSLLRTS